MGTADGWTSDDWYREGEEQLHFFPREKRLVLTIGRRIFAEAEAWGGIRPIPGRQYRGMSPQLTTPGTYVIHDHGPHVTKKWNTSLIPWGTPLKLDPGGGHVLYEAGSGSNRWRRVDLLIPEATVDAVHEEYTRLYGSIKDIYDSNGDGIPDKWVFNDFGPWAIRYFLDPNRNRRLDAGEDLTGEMIHTTPKNEAQTAREERTGERGLVKLEYSHGCIHIKPVDRRRFLMHGAFKRGNLMVVHSTAELIPESLTR